MSILLKHLKQSQYTGVFTKSIGDTGSIKSRDVVKEQGKDTHYLTIKFADYTVIDDADDLMLRGAFDESFKNAEKSNRKIAFCWQHNVKDPIGLIVKFWDDAEGGYVKVKLSDFETVPNAKRLWIQSQEGIIDQASFGYSYDWKSTKYITEEESDRPDKKSYWAVGNVFLHEISAVTLGCNMNTSVMESEEGQKSLITELLNRDDIRIALMKERNPEIEELYKEYGIKLHIGQKKGLFSRTQ